MRHRYTIETPVSLEDTFYCKARRKVLKLEKCLDDYLNANAFDKRRSACYRCPQGRRNREAFACGGCSGDKEAEY
jgi:hypothetical protein